MANLQPRLIATPGAYTVRINDAITVYATTTDTVYDLTLPAVVSNLSAQFSVRVVFVGSPGEACVVNLIPDPADVVCILNQGVNQTVGATVPLVGIDVGSLTAGTAASIAPILFTAVGVGATNNPTWLGFSALSASVSGAPGVQGLAGVTGSAGTPATLISGDGGGSTTGVGGDAGYSSIDTGAGGTGGGGTGVAGPIYVGPLNALTVLSGRLDPGSTTNMPFVGNHTLSARGLASRASRVITDADSPFNLTSLSATDYPTDETSVTLLCDCSAGNVVVNLPNIAAGSDQATLRALNWTYRVVGYGDPAGNNTSITVFPTGGDLIGGLASFTLPNTIGACVEFEALQSGNWLAIAVVDNPYAHVTEYIASSGSYSILPNRRVIADVATGTATLNLPAVGGFVLNSDIEFIFDLDAGGLYTLAPAGTDSIVDSGETLGAGVSWTIGGPGNGASFVVRLIPYFSGGSGFWQVVRQPEAAINGLNGVPGSVNGRNASAVGGAGYPGVTGGAGGVFTTLGGPGGSGVAQGGTGGDYFLDAGPGGPSTTGATGVGGNLYVGAFAARATISGHVGVTWTHTGRLVAPDLGKTIAAPATTAFTPAAGVITPWQVPAAGTTTATLPDTTTLAGDGEVVTVVIESVGAAGLITFAVAGGNTLMGPALTAVTPVVGTTFQFTNVGTRWYVLSRYL